MLKITHRGNFKNTERFLQRAKSMNIKHSLAKYGQMGLDALIANTPVDSGVTAASWSYDVKMTSTGYALIWTNSSESEGIPIIILLQYGHGTKNGGYIEGRDIINSAIRPVFDQIAEEAWKEVT